MRADFDSSANAISIVITDAQSADRSDEVHPRAIVALAARQPVEVQLLYPDLGDIRAAPRRSGPLRPRP